MAASIIIRQAHLIKKDKDNIFTVTALADYSCQYELDESENISGDSSGLDEDGVGTSYSYSYSYSDPSYNWSFSDGGTSNTAEGTHTFKNLTKGAKQVLTAAITISITETISRTAHVHEWVYQGMSGATVPVYKETGEKDPVTGEPIKVQVGTTWDPNAGEKVYKVEETRSYPCDPITNNLSASETNLTITIYTRPGIFSDYDFSEDDIIQDDSGLSASTVAKWCTHCGQFLSWNSQDDKYDDADDCNVTSGSFITAAWYNKCAILCGCNTRVSNDHSQDSSLITAQVFNDLGTAISKGDSNE